MTEEEIKKARENYIELLEVIKKYFKIKDRLKELEKDPLVREYLILLKIQENFNISKNIVHSSFSEIAKNTIDSDEMLVYGGIKHRWLSNPCFVYRGLDSENDYEVELSKLDEYESTKGVIKLPETLYTCFYPDSLGQYYDLRNAYFESLIANDSETSIKEATKKLGACYYKNGRKVE